MPQRGVCQGIVAKGNRVVMGNRTSRAKLTNGVAEGHRGGGAGKKGEDVVRREKAIKKGPPRGAQMIRGLRAARQDWGRTEKGKNARVNNHLGGKLAHNAGRAEREATGRRKQTLGHRQVKLKPPAPLGGAHQRKNIRETLRGASRHDRSRLGDMNIRFDAPKKLDFTAKKRQTQNGNALAKALSCMSQVARNLTKTHKNRSTQQRTSTGKNLQGLRPNNEILHPPETGGDKA